jgi:hypothetical protein
MRCSCSEQSARRLELRAGGLFVFDSLADFFSAPVITPHTEIPVTTHRPFCLLRYAPMTFDFFALSPLGSGAFQTLGMTDLTVVVM